MTTPHSVLIVGCGNIAGGFDAGRPADAPPLSHAGAFTRNPHFAIDACVEPDTVRRLAFMARWQVPQGAATIAELDGRRFDVISLCSPTALHGEHLQAALALGPRLIFCEKPLSPSVAQSERLVGLCREAGVLLAVNHNRRWDAAVRRLRDELRNGRWGPLRSVVASYNKGVLNNGSHLLDLLNLWFGPLELLAAGAAVAGLLARKTRASPVLLRCADGTPVHLNISINCGHAG
jgi:predicted dehydrogenase